MTESETARRWETVDTLIHRWFPAGPEPRPVDLRHTEARLGPLSPALGALVARAARADVWGVQDRILPPDEWRAADGHVVIARENQGVTEWGVPEDALREADPPVALRSPDTGEWTPEFGSVSEFAVGWVLLAVKFSPSEHWVTNAQVDDEPLERLRAAYAPLPLSLTWPEPPTWFVTLPDSLVEVDGDTWLWLTARDEAAFDAAIAELRRLGVDVDPG